MLWSVVDAGSLLLPAKDTSTLLVVVKAGVAITPVLLANTVNVTAKPNATLKIGYFITTLRYINTYIDCTTVYVNAY